MSVAGSSSVDEEMKHVEARRELVVVQSNYNIKVNHAAAQAASTAVCKSSTPNM